MASVSEKAETLKESCKRVQRAMEESDGAPRPNGSMFDHWFDEIPGWFQPFSDLPDGPALRRHQDTMIEEVCKYLNREWGPPAGYEGGLANVNPELNTVDTIKANLSGWTGLAARNFDTNYLTKFDGYTKNLYTASYVAYQTLAAEAKLWETAHSDAHALLDNAQKVVDGMIGVSASEAFRFALTALGSAITVKQAAAGDRGLTLIKELTSATKDYAFKEGSARTPAELMEPLKDSVSELKKKLKEKEQEIADGIDENIGYLNSHEQEYVAAPIAWNLAHTDPESEAERNKRPADERGQQQEGTDTLGEDNHES